MTTAGPTQLPPWSQHRLSCDTCSAPAVRWVMPAGRPEAAVLCCSTTAAHVAIDLAIHSPTGSCSVPVGMPWRYWIHSRLHALAGSALAQVAR